MIKNFDISILSKYLKIFFILDLIVLFISFFQNEYFIWIINTQIAFFCVFIICIGSFIGYGQNIKKRTDLLMFDLQTSLDIDSIDKIEDLHDLYSDNVKEEEIKTDSIKNTDTNKIQNTLRSFSGIISAYRIIGYIILIFGFFYLNNNGLFNAIPYLFGVSIIPLSFIILFVYSLVFNAKRKHD